MPEVTLSFENHDHIRTMFGSQDRFLRRVRDETGVDVVVRGDELRLKGDDEEVRQAMEVFSTLKGIVERTGGLSEKEFLKVLAVDGPGVSDAEPPSSINVFEKAKQVQPRTPGQGEYVNAIRKNDLVFCIGPAGCGKTYLSVAMAINALRTEVVRKIVLVRPAVEAGERLGFLPGDMFAKVNPYLRPLLDSLYDILDFEQVKRYMENDVIEIVPLAFMRGRTLNNTFMILDEAQNTTVTQMKMFLTRMGEGSKIVATGDVTQMDLAENITCGLTDAIRRLDKISSVGVVRLTGLDIVRHRLVRDIVGAYDDQKSKGKPRKR